MAFALFGRPASGGEIVDCAALNVRPRSSGWPEPVSVAPGTSGEMAMRYFVNLPKDGRGVLACFHFPAKHAYPRAL